MSAFGDAMGAIKNVVLMQSNLERVQREVERLNGDFAGFREALHAMDRRLVRLETLEEAELKSARKRHPPAIEG